MFVTAEALEESLLAVKSEFVLMQRVIKRLHSEKQQAEAEMQRIQKLRELQLVEKSALASENAGFKNTYKTLEKELRK